jgi:phage terminase large subunit GpA-like protein
MILTIELVPETSWYSNMRKVMTTEDWDKLRRSTYAKYNHICGICGATGMLHCHEIWEYDDRRHIQKLKGFIAICPLCHHVKHIGFAAILAKRGELDYDDVVNHFLKVNKCSLREFEKYREEAFEEWEERSSHSWKVDLGEFQKLVSERR